eukprot:1599471-Pleurochrysis_carterae.AAC.1
MHDAIFSEDNLYEASAATSSVRAAQTESIWPWARVLSVGSFTYGWLSLVLGRVPDIHKWAGAYLVLSQAFFASGSIPNDFKWLAKLIIGVAAAVLGLMDSPKHDAKRTMHATQGETASTLRETANNSIRLVAASPVPPGHDFRYHPDIDIRSISWRACFGLRWAFLTGIWLHVNEGPRRSYTGFNNTI